MKEIIAILAMVGRHQFSPAGVVNALLIAGITAGVTSWATVQRIDARLAEMVQDMREIKAEHAQIRERVVKMETRIDGNKPASR